MMLYIPLRGTALSLALVMVSICAHAQTDSLLNHWTQIAVRTSNDLYNIRFLAPDFGVAVGLGGTILITRDSGLHWTDSYSPQGQSLYGISIISRDSILVGGDNKSMARTTDGGTTWLPVSLPREIEIRSMTQPLNGFILATGGDGTGGHGAVIYSTDNGATWTANNDQNILMSEPLYAGIATDSSTIVAGFDGSVFVSTDRATHFDQVPTPIHDWLMNGRVIGQSIELVGNNGRRIRSTDNGKTWDTLPRFGRDFIVDMEALGPEARVAISKEGNIFSTSDGIHMVVDSQFKGKVLGGIAFPTTTRGFLVGATGIVASAGVSIRPWSKVSAPVTTSLRDVVFDSPQHGLVVGDKGTIIGTSDGGGSWGKSNTNTNLGLKSLLSVGSGLWYAVGDSGTVISSHDGGMNWTNELTSGDSAQLRCVRAQADTRIAVGYNKKGGVIWRQTGKTPWVAVSIPPTVHGLSSVLPVSPGLWYAAGDPSTMYVSSDDGLSWNAEAAWSGGMMSFAKTGGTVYCETANGTTIYQANQGWSGAYQVPRYDTMWSVSFSAGGKGFGVGNRGNILESVTLPNVWSPMRCPVVENLYGVCSIDSIHAVAVGAKGTILLYSPQAPKADVSDHPKIQGDRVPKILLTNYPNPFTSSTTLSFAIQVPDNIVISVADLLGNTVGGKVIGRVASGLQSIKLSREELGLESAGVYLCTVSTSTSQYRCLIQFEK